MVVIFFFTDSGNVILCMSLYDRALRYILNGLEARCVYESFQTKTNDNVQLGYRTVHS